VQEEKIQHMSNYLSADGNSCVLVDPGEERADPGVGLSVSRLAALSSERDDADLLPDTIHNGQRTTAVTLTSTKFKKKFQTWHRKWNFCITLQVDLVLAPDVQMVEGMMYLP